MFWNKSQKQEDDNISLANVQTIPSDFYGGANPVVTFKNVEKQVHVNVDNGAKMTPVEKKLLDKERVVGGENQLHPVNVFSSKKKIVIIMSLLFILLLGGSSMYYYFQMQPKTQNKVSDLENNISRDFVPAVSLTSTVQSDDIQTSTPVEPIVESKLAIEYPSTFISESIDMDNDDIADLAEPIFGTDPAVPDFDNDNYNDGHEVYNLYNPAGKEPIKLIDSGVVSEYRNPQYGYKVYYPKTWISANIDPNYKDILFTSATGESIEIITSDKSSLNQTFVDWFGENAKTEKYSDLLDFSSKFGDTGNRRNDFLVYYFEDAQHVHIIKYVTNEQVINYRIFLKMMARSFRLQGNNNILDVNGVVSPESQSVYDQGQLQ